MNNDVNKFRWKKMKAKKGNQKHALGFILFYTHTHTHAHIAV